MVEPVADWHQLWSEASSRYGVSPTIHTDDLLWKFLVGHSFFVEPSHAAGYYFSDGAESARKLAELIRQHLGARELSLMEFASGYGMVSRHLPRAMPEMKIVCCDIHPAATQFIQDELGIPTILSKDVPEELEFGQRFDVVFALSFFSHMPESTFGRWLAALYRHVNPGGLLIFTTHGLASRPALGNPEISKSGFWFNLDSEQGDLDGASYGSTISTPEFVVPTLYRHTGAPLADLRLGYWWQHQDLWVVARPSSGSPPPLIRRLASFGGILKRTVFPEAGRRRIQVQIAIRSPP